MTMKLRKYVGLVLLLLLMLGAFSSCSAFQKNGSSGSSASSSLAEKNAEAKTRIVLIQYEENILTNKIKEAFLARIEEWGYDTAALSIEYKNAQGDMDLLKTICDEAVASKVTAMIGIAEVASTQAVKTASGTGIPVIYSGCRDASAITMNGSGGITGVSDPYAADKALDMAFSLKPDITKVGVLSYAAETDGFVQQIRQYCQDKSIEVVEQILTDGADLSQAAQTVFGATDVVFLGIENHQEIDVTAAIQAAMDAKKPLYVTADFLVKNGAFASINVDYNEIGIKAADMAVEVIEGRNVADIQPVTMASYGTYINLTTADRIGLQIPEELVRSAVLYENWSDGQSEPTTEPSEDGSEVEDGE